MLKRNWNRAFSIRWSKSGVRIPMAKTMPSSFPVKRQILTEKYHLLQASALSGHLEARLWVRPLSFIFLAAALMDFTMFTYPVHLQRFPSIALRISPSLGFGFLSRRKSDDMSIPGVQ